MGHQRRKRQSGVYRYITEENIHEGFSYQSLYIFPTAYATCSLAIWFEYFLPVRLYFAVGKILSKLLYSAKRFT